MLLIIQKNIGSIQLEKATRTRLFPFLISLFTTKDHTILKIFDIEQQQIGRLWSLIDSAQWIFVRNEMKLQIWWWIQDMSLENCLSKQIINEKDVNSYDSFRMSTRFFFFFFRCTVCIHSERKKCFFHIRINIMMIDESNQFCVYVPVKANGICKHESILSIYL